MSKTGQNPGLVGIQEKALVAFSEPDLPRPVTNVAFTENKAQNLKSGKTGNPADGAGHLFAQKLIKNFQKSNMV